MLKWLPAVVGAVVALIGAFSDILLPFVQANPTLVAVLAGLATVIASLLKSPVSSPPPSS